MKGLSLYDPVQAFFDWCKERESIRITRNDGHPYPWTDDPIFQKGRFLNTFREDDKGSIAIRRFCKPYETSFETLVHALFFSRWCNKADTLDKIVGIDLHNTRLLRSTLLEKIEQPWCSDVYPVEAVMWKNKSYDRFEACTQLFPELISFLTDSIGKAHQDVTKATKRINSQFKMNNDFPIFMAVIDISWFSPHVISPDSPVPTGIGAQPYLDLLQDFLGMTDHHTTALKMIDLQKSYWPEARRKFTPVDIEYLSCECRKYYSYVNGTKSFKGRNLFVPPANE